MSDWQGSGSRIQNLEWVEKFRQDFPEFSHSSPEKYEDSVIQFWYETGDSLLNEKRWGKLRERGLQLYVAHNLVVQTMHIKASEEGESLVGLSGVISSQSAGSVSVGIDYNLTSEQEAGNFNLTIYGNLFWQLAQIVGTGGYQVY